MTITTISDLHGYLPLLQPCNVVCICGDISPIGFPIEINIEFEVGLFEILPWVKMLDCQKVIFYCRNHDFFLYTNDDGYSVKQVIENSDVKNKLIYLENEEYVYNGLNSFMVVLM